MSRLDGTRSALSAGVGTALCYRAFGVSFSVSTDDESIAEPLLSRLPPGSTPAAPGEVDRAYAVRSLGPDRWSLTAEGSVVLEDGDLRALLLRFEHELDAAVAERSPSLVFVRAGVVGWRGKAVIVAGAGASTLVAALLRSGAEFYSDVFAVADEQGLVYPYGRPLSLRDPDGSRARRTPEEIGGSRGNGGLPIGLVALTDYRQGALWRPRPVPTMECLRVLLAAVPGVEARAEAAAGVLARALFRAQCVRGDRGDTRDVVFDLLGRIRA